MKKETRDSHDASFRSVDFGVNNVLSHLYAYKEHKSHTLRKRNDNVLNLIKDQFKSREEFYAQNETDKDVEALE